MPDDKPFRVLCISGGGMRGIYAAAYLSRLSTLFSRKKNIANAFEMFVGTSTGAILACGLAMGKEPKEIEELFRRHGRDIFPKPMPSKIWCYPFFIPGHRSRLRKGAITLNAHLDNAFEKTTLEEIAKQQKYLAVASINLHAHAPRVFKSWDGRDSKYSLAEVCLASTAAPLARAAARLENREGSGSEIFIDGGLFANNPVIIGVIDSMKLEATRNRPIEIYSLGTYSLSYSATLQEGKEARSFWWWRFGTRALMSSIDAQDKHYQYMPNQLLTALKARFADLPTGIREQVSKPFSYIEFHNEPTAPDHAEFLQFDNARPAALEWLTRQAHRDAEATYALSVRTKRDDPDFKSIRLLFQSG